MAIGNSQLALEALRPAVHRTMKNLSFFGLLAFVLSGCLLVPVQEQTFKNANGGEITCKQVGAGLVSSSIGKSRFDDCAAKARADGYQ